MEREMAEARFKSLIFGDEIEKQAGLSIDCDLNKGDIEVLDGIKKKQICRQKAELMVVAVACEIALIIAMLFVVFLVLGEKFSAGTLTSFFWIGAGFFSSLLLFLIRKDIVNNIFKTSFEPSRKFSVKFYDGFVCAESSSKGISIIPYSSVGGSIIEYDDNFVITSSDQNEYIITKRFLDGAKAEKIREYAKKFEERYIVATSNG